MRIKKRTFPNLPSKKEIIDDAIPISSKLLYLFGFMNNLPAFQRHNAIKLCFIREHCFIIIQTFPVISPVEKGCLPGAAISPKVMLLQSLRSDPSTGTISRESLFLFGHIYCSISSSFCHLKQLQMHAKEVVIKCRLSRIHQSGRAEV